MIEGRIIVCVANSWDYDPTSKHQIMKILSGGNDIVWVDYHGTRRPGVNLADLKATFSALQRFARGIRRVTPSITRLTPLVIPGSNSTRLGRLHQQLLIAQIRRAIRSIGGARGKPLQVWTFAPDVPYLVGQFGEECFLYYCVDEYGQFEGFDRDRIVAAENELIDRADVVVTTSAALFEAKRVRRADIILARHGVDYDHFAAAWRSDQPVPADLVSIPRPILGFFGLIHHWVDHALLARVAELRPHYSFVLLGDCRVDVSSLKSLPNVYLLGRRPYDQLPAYCAAFNAGLLLFVRSAMTRNINPIKMHEYLAAGLGVVSTPLPEAERYRGPIRIADTAESFAGACDEVLSRQGVTNRRAIARVVEHESWASKVEWLSETIMNRLHPPPTVISKSTSEVAGAGPRLSRIIHTAENAEYR